MSKSEIPNSIPQNPNQSSNQQQQLEEEEDEFEHVAFAPGSVIAAQPISMVAPEDCWPKPAPKKRSAEEAAERPKWLPEDWRMDVRRRSSGATAGTFDRYYFEPTGQRKFRSKNEVLHFLETGNKLKRKLDPEGSAAPSGSPMSQKQKKSSVKRKNPHASNPDITHSANAVKSGAPQGI